MILCSVRVWDVVGRCLGVYSVLEGSSNTRLHAFLHATLHTKPLFTATDTADSCCIVHRTCTQSSAVSLAIQQRYSSDTAIQRYTAIQQICCITRALGTNEPDGCERRQRARRARRRRRRRNRSSRRRARAARGEAAPARKPTPCDAESP